MRLLSAAAALALLCACASPGAGPKAPAWLSSVPTPDASAKYFVGRSSGLTESEARNAAFSDALYQIVSELQVDCSYLYSELITKLGEDIRIVGKTETRATIQGAQVSDSRIEERRSNAGAVYYDARLLVAFPHAERAAWRERILAAARQRLEGARSGLDLLDGTPDPLKAVALLSQAFRDISESRVAAAMDASVAGDAAALESAASRRANELFRKLKLEALPGQVAVKVAYEGRPLPDLPVRFSAGKRGGKPATPRIIRTDASGIARPDRDFLLANRKEASVVADLNLRTMSQPRKTLPMSGGLRAAVYASESGAGSGRGAAFLSRTAAALRERDFFPVELPAGEAGDEDLRAKAADLGALFLVVGRSSIRACDNPRPDSYLCRAEGSIRGLDPANGSILFEAALGPEDRILGIGDTMAKAGAGALEKLALRLSEKLKDELAALR
ncbi:MAG TPA: hypothetical protein DCM05_07075 [Elusimicrobia bacterium]|nr:hypothetical protein [Elusimicrobiota bacterium]